MASNIYKSSSIVGLGTISSITVPDAGEYLVEGKMALPSISQGNSANSAVVTVVNKNGSPVYTSSAGSQGFNTKISCAASDVITVVLTSSAAVDNQKNVIKSTITLSLGPN